MELDVDFARSHFPALAQGWGLMDNAGGSVTPTPVIERITRYLREFQVQLGASYPMSAEAESLVRAGEAAAATLVGATPEEAIVGPNTTSNLQLMARALGPQIEPGDEVIVTNLDHEANIGCWRGLASHGAEVRTWRLRPETASLHLVDLEALLTPRTRLVAFTHCANVVGEIVDVAAVVAAVRANRPDTIVCADGVAYAPHRLVDVRALGVDLYAVSLYKVYGPHLGVLFGRRELLLEAKSRNHGFVAEDQLPYKFQPGNVTHELAAGLTGILEYFDRLAAHHGIEEPSARRRLARVYALIAAHEQRLAERVLEFLRARADVTIIGPKSADADLRVPTIAFAVDGVPASVIPPALEAQRVAIRFGHFYAPAAIDALGLAERGGVARISMAHYNSLAEVDRLIDGLGALLDRR
ncbi:MAG: cysteine desulfurase-like protein [Myxococcota bacterium]